MELSLTTVNPVAPLAGNWVTRIVEIPDTASTSPYWTVRYRVMEMQYDKAGKLLDVIVSPRGARLLLPA